MDLSNIMPGIFFYSGINDLFSKISQQRQSSNINSEYLSILESNPRQQAAPAGVPCCRPGIHGVAPTGRQQGTPTGGSAVQMMNGPVE
jgi:hypothetical protein